MDGDYGINLLQRTMFYMHYRSGPSRPWQLSLVLYLQHLMMQLIATWVNSYSLGCLLVAACSPRCIIIQNRRMEHVLAWRTHCASRCLARKMILAFLNDLTR